MKQRFVLFFITALVLTVAALLMYNYYTHGWFLSHKNR